MSLTMEITRRDYAIDIPPADFDHLMKSDNWSWSGPTLEEHDFSHLRGVHSIEHNGHFGSAVYLKIDAEDDTPEVHKWVLEVITDRIADIKKARIGLVGEMADELVDALGSDDWPHIRNGLLHTAVAEFTKFDAIEFRKAMVDERGFSLTDTCMQSTWLSQLTEKFPELLETT